MAGYAGSTLQEELNRLANGGASYPTTFLDAQGAANKWAGTTGLALIGALNAKAGTKGLDLNLVCNRIAGTSGLEAVTALRGLAS